MKYAHEQEISETNETDVQAHEGMQYMPDKYPMRFEGIPTLQHEDGVTTRNGSRWHDQRLHPTAIRSRVQGRVKY